MRHGKSKIPMTSLFLIWIFFDVDSFKRSFKIIQASAFYDLFKNTDFYQFSAPFFPTYVKKFFFPDYYVFYYIFIYHLK